MRVEVGRQWDGTVSAGVGTLRGGEPESRGPIPRLRAILHLCPSRFLTPPFPLRVCVCVCVSITAPSFLLSVTLGLFQPASISFILMPLSFPCFNRLTFSFV